MSKAHLLEKAVIISSSPDASDIELAITLAALHDSGRGELKRFAEKSGMSPRKVYYLAEVGEKLKKVRIRKAQLERIGWSKLQIIAKNLTVRNAERLFDLAEGHTSHQLKSLMRGGEEKPKSHCVLMYFTPEQYQEFEQAILSNGGKRSGRGLIQKEAAIINLINSVTKVSGED